MCVRTLHYQYDRHMEIQEEELDDISGDRCVYALTLSICQIHGSRVVVLPCVQRQNTALKGSRLSTLLLTKQRQQPEHHTNCLLVPWDLSGYVSSSGSYPGIMASAYRTAVTVPATLDLEKMVLRK